MATHLLDVNVLLAYAWPNHEFHVAAERWFDGAANDGWATCPLTQCAFVRISANARIIRPGATPAAAKALLEKITRHSAHQFWPDDLSIVSSPLFATERIQGHQQVTDAYLLALCVSKRAKLATFDSGIKSLARDANEAAAIELISS